MKDRMAVNRRLRVRAGRAARVCRRSADRAGGRRVDSKGGVSRKSSGVGRGRRRSTWSSWLVMSMLDRLAESRIVRSPPALTAARMAARTWGAVTGPLLLRCVATPDWTRALPALGAGYVSGSRGPAPMVLRMESVPPWRSISKAPHQHRHRRAPARPQHPHRPAAGRREGAGPVRPHRDGDGDARGLGRRHLPRWRGAGGPGMARMGRHRRPSGGPLRLGELEPRCQILVRRSTFTSRTKGCRPRPGAPQQR